MGLGWGKLHVVDNMGKTRNGATKKTWISHPPTQEECNMLRDALVYFIENPWHYPTHLNNPNWWWTHRQFQEAQLVDHDLKWGNQFEQLHHLEKTFLLHGSMASNIMLNTQDRFLVHVMPTLSLWIQLHYEGDDGKRTIRYRVQRIWMRTTTKTMHDPLEHPFIQKSVK